MPWAIPNLSSISNISRLWGWGGLVPSWPYTMQIGNAGNLSPSDATTYYLGNGLNSSTVDATDFRVYVPQRGIIRKCYINIRNGGTAGSWETSAISLQVTDVNWVTTAYEVSAAVTTNAVNQVFSSTSLSIPVNEWDYICGKWVTPTRATNPTNLVFSFVFAVEPVPLVLSWSKVVIQGGWTWYTAVSSTDRFFWNWPWVGTDTVRIYIPYTWTITYGVVNIRNSTNGTPAAWTAEFFLDANAWTYESIGTTTMGVTNVDLSSVLTTPVTAWDFLCLRITNPVWTTAPTWVAIAFTFVLTIT